MNTTSAQKGNVLERQFYADSSNRVWTSDVTCYKLGDRYYIHMCNTGSVFEEGDRVQIIPQKQHTAYYQHLSGRPDKAWDWPRFVISQRPGHLNTSHSFCNLLASLSIVQSFSSPVQPHDNAVTETFFSTLKREELYRKDYPSEKKFKQSIDTYMTFYNTKRPHKTLKNLTPCQAEERFYANQE